jgi:dihydrofolate reductase
MPRLIYAVITSLDGYVADTEGNFDWAEPDADVHRFINDLQRPIGTYLYGRRLYETMAYWDDPDLTDAPAFVRDFTDVWQAADKIVFSNTLGSAFTARTRIERDFDPAAVAELKESADSDHAVGGPNLAAHALRAGLVDECQLFLAPIAVGGGNQAFSAGARVPLELLDERRFDSGIVYLRYRVRM